MAHGAGMARRWRDEGQTSLEWLGIAVAVALLVGGLAAFAPGLGVSVADGIHQVICRILGGDCSGDAEEDVCTVRIETNSIHGGVTVLSVNPELTLLEQLRVNSDGTAVVILSATGGLGAEFVLGVTGEVGEIDAGTGAGLEVGGEGRVAGIFEFETEEEAREFISDVNTTAAAAAGGGILGPLGSAVAGWIASELTDLDVPTPSGVMVLGGVGAEANGTAGIADIEGGSTTAAGFIYHPENGHTTLILSLEPSIGGEISPAISAGVDAEHQLRVELDADGNPVAAEIRSTVNGDVGGLTGAVAQTVLGDDAIVTQVGQALIGMEQSATGQVRLIARLDLDDPVLGQQASELIDALLDGDLSGTLAAGADVVEQVVDRTEVTVDVYVGEEDALPLEIEAGKGIAVGVEFEISDAEADLVGSFIRRPGGGVEQRCE